MLLQINVMEIVTSAKCLIINQGDCFSKSRSVLEKTVSPLTLSSVSRGERRGEKGELGGKRRRREEGGGRREEGGGRREEGGGRREEGGGFRLAEGVHAFKKPIFQRSQNIVIRYNKF